jgi:hypothetical protein
MTKTTTVTEFVKLLTESINEKINECRGEIHPSHNPVFNKSMLIDIQTLEWALGQINQLENNNEVRRKITTTTNAADFAESLTEIIRCRIGKSRNDLRQSHDIIQKDKLILEIDRLDWVLAQINSIQNRESNLKNMMKQKLF